VKPEDQVMRTSLTHEIKATTARAPRVSSARLAALLLPALAALPLAHGCAGGGSDTGSGAVAGGVSQGGTGASVGAGATPGGVNGTSQGPALSNAAQANVALAALSQGTPDVRITPGGLASYNDLLARNWPHAMTLLQSEAQARLQAAVGQALGGLRIVSVRSVTLDAGAPPVLTASLPSASPTQQVEILVPPAPAAWGLRAGFDIGGTIPFTVFGVQTGVTILMGVDVAVTEIRMREGGTLDLSNPLAPRIASTGAPQVNMRLSITSQDPLFSTVSALITQILDPVIRVALLLSPTFLQQQVGIALAAMPATGDWGKGGPGLPAPSGAPDLLAFADGLSAKMQSDMTPFDQLFPTAYDRPVSGGNVVGPRHFGDSALWTGGLLAAEAMRADLTGDPAALAAADSLLRGIEINAEVVPAPFDGLLARCAVPSWSPITADMTGDTTFAGHARGQAYRCYGDASRDSYTGTTFGLGQAIHRLPAPMKARAAATIGRLVDHLERYGWAVYQAPGQANNPQPGVPRMSVTCIQSPALILAMLRVAATGDAGRYGPAFAARQELADLIWLPGWLSSEEVHEAYFKFNLENMALMTLEMLDGDPARYRSYLKLQAILRETVGHHQNPWFDSSWAAAVPSQVQAMAPQVQTALEKFTARPRRGFGSSLMNDPTIAKVLYTPTLPNATGAPSSGISTGPRPMWVAVLPVPIEKRPTTAFLWSSSPFEIEGWEDEHVEHPGVDFMLPYWIGRSYGLLR